MPNHSQPQANKVLDRIERCCSFASASRLKRCSFSTSTSTPTQQKHLPCHCQRNRRTLESKKYSTMTNDEIVNLCKPKERPRARRVVDALRKYLIQVSESKGFDFDVFPGHFNGVTSVMPIECSRYSPLNRFFGHGDPEVIARSVIDQYNLKHKETEYKVENIERMHLDGDGLCRAFTYYITFRARDVKNEAEAATMKTFQTSVMMDGRHMVKIFRCMIKANCCSS